MIMKIIEVRKNHIFIDKGNGEVGVEPNTPYFYHRLVVSNNERIFKEFPKDSITVQETFNEMIFNITVGNGVVTTRPSIANKLVQSLDDPEKIIDIFNEYRTNELNIKLLESILARYGERIRLINEGFLVDDLFLVDRDGCAFNWKNGNIDTSIRTNLSNGGICIVVNKMSNQEFVDPMTNKTIKHKKSLEL